MSEDAGQNPTDVNALAGRVDGLTGAVQQLLDMVIRLNETAQTSVDLSVAALEADFRLTQVMRVLTHLAGQDESGLAGTPDLKATLADCISPLAPNSSHILR